MKKESMKPQSAQRKDNQKLYNLLIFDDFSVVKF